MLGPVRERREINRDYLVAVLATIAVEVVIVVIAVVALAGADRSDPIHYYRVIGQAAIAVETDSAPGVWTRATGVEETSSSVTVHVSSLGPFLPAARSWPYEVTVLLGNPLGDRTVIDGSDGLPVSAISKP